MHWTTVTEYLEDLPLGYTLTVVVLAGRPPDNSTQQLKPAQKERESI
jgi:hypothetical protein